MAIYKNGAKVDKIYKNGKAVNKIYKDGSEIYTTYKMPKIVTFDNGTDEEISAMLEAHYAGTLNIADYWHVGDTRVVHINATNSGTTNHVVQNMTMVIMDFEHDDLTTPINSKTKAAVSVGFRETMANKGKQEREYYWGKSYTPVQDTDNYSLSPLRTWLNGELLNALPSTFSSLIKEVNKKNLARHTSTAGAPLITKDKIWLLSYPEAHGTESMEDYKGNPVLEGEQYEYMKNENNRTKHYNNNGMASSNLATYWLRSPSSYIGRKSYYWLYTDGSFADNDDGETTDGLAPAFCL